MNYSRLHTFPDVSLLKAGAFQLLKKRTGMQLVLCLLALMPGLILAAEFSERLQWLQQEESHSEAPTSIETNAQALSNYLDTEGRLALPEGFSGSFDPAGFEMVLDKDGAPRFFPQGGPADPDDRWDDGFFLGSGCDGSVQALAAGPTGELYLGGEFLFCGGVAANRVVRYEPGSGTWSALGSGGGNGVNGAVRALVVMDSDLYVGGDFWQANVGAAIAANRIARWDGSAWLALGSGGGNGVNGTVRALAVLDSDLYVGGDFWQANVGAAITASRIVRWDGSTWSPLGSGGGNGVNSTVFALAVLGSDLYVGGGFNQANVGAAITANYIARWNGSDWSALGSGGGNGVNSGVSALVVLGTDLYVGGGFIEANVGSAITANRIARWDGSVWSHLGSGGGNGVSNPVSALAVMGSDLYLGGSFSEANVGSAITANRIARWDGSTWAALGSGGGNGVNDTVRALAMLGSDLYVGGVFWQTNVGSAITANRIARWDDSAWSVLGSGSGNGANGTVLALAVLGADLYVGGWFTVAGGVAANRIARWDGSTWSALGSGEGNGVSGPVEALAVLGSDLYVGGSFTQANVGEAIATRSIARWDGSTWSALGSGGGDGVNGLVFALAVLGNDLYVGGWFNEVNLGAAITANRIARWDGSTWSSLGSGGGNGVNQVVYALAVLGSDLYVGGAFTEANVGAAITTRGIARWDGSAWSALGSGGGNGVSSAVVRALAVLGGDLYVGGDFAQVNVGAAIPANRIARWDGSTWSALGSGGGNGVNDTVRALVALGGDLYVGGEFTEANVGEAISANRISRWNGSAWSSLGSGMDTTVRALAATDLDTLYLGGNLRLAGGRPSSFIGRYTARGTLDISLAGSGSGSVVSNPTGLDCPGTCSAPFTWDQPIELTAAAEPHSTFVGWSGGGCSGTGLCVVDFDQDMSVTAEFELLTYTIGGTVFDLAGSGLVLQNNGGDNLLINSDGAFVFNTALPDGSAYDVTVAVQPTDLSQTCTVSNGDGTLAGDDVTNVEVTCTTNSFTIGGTVSDLAGSGLVLQNNYADDLPISADGSFQFNTALLDGSPYDITVSVQPTNLSQICSVANSNGTLAGANVTNVAITCITNTFTIGGTVSDLAGSGLVLQNNSGNDLMISADGSFTFETALIDGSSYDVTVFEQPTNLSQTCTVTNGSNTLAGADVTNIDVSCTTNSYTIGGSASDLAGSGLVLQNNSGDDLPISADGFFTFNTALVDGSSYDVTVSVQPINLSQTCTVTNGDGVLAGANVIDVTITCATNTFTIGGAVSDLAGSGLVLQNNSGDDLPISADGPFTFNTALIDGSSYDVTVSMQPTNLSQTCTVSNGDGTLAGADVTNIDVSCTTNSYTIGGTVSDLSGSGLVLQNNSGDDLPISANGSFTFDTALIDGSGYDVIVSVQPTNLSQTCTVTNGSNTLAGADVTNVAVTCTTDTYTIGGTVSDLAGSGLVLQNNSGDDLPISADGSFTFSTALIDGSSYDVTVYVQPTNLSQTCTVANGSNALAGADVINVAVTCTTDTFTISGTVSDLAGSGLVLRNNSGDDLPISAEGSFTFATALIDGSSYNVTVLTQPTGPNQTCTVSEGQGTLTGGDVDSVEVNCVTDTYLVRPEAGLGGSLDPDTSQLVEHGQTVAFDVLADSGYTIGPVTGCDGELVETTYTTGPITAACTVTAEFIPQTVTSIVPTAGPLRLDQATTFSITVTAPTDAPQDGMVMVSADTGESCTDDSAPDTNGSVATFSCQITLENPGSRTLTATYSNSTTHGDSSSDPLAVQVMRFADLSILAEADQAWVDGGDVIGWLVEVRNQGPDDAANTAIEINLSALPDDLTWVCEAIGTAICPAGSGSGQIILSVDLPSGSGLDFVLSGEVPSTQSANFELSATVNPDEINPSYTHDPDLANNHLEISVTVMRIFRDRFE